MARFRIRVLLACLCLLTLGPALPAGRAWGKAVEVRLVAAEQPTGPLVSDLANFRASYLGGLIAVQWPSRVKIGQQDIFPVTALASAAPTLALEQPLANSGDQDLAKELGDTIGDNPAKAAALRPIDVIDPLFKDRTLHDGKKVGLRHRRVSSAVLDLSAGSTLTPGGQAVDTSGDLARILCYPVVITARVAGQGNEPAAFIPDLRWQNRDLLSDSLFEYSPDMPLGDDAFADEQGKSDPAQGDGFRGGHRLFRRLTMYLPACPDDQPYQLNGQTFSVSAQGVKVLPGKPGPVQLSAGGAFDLTLLLPAPPGKPAVETVAVFKDLPPGTLTDVGEELSWPPGKAMPSILVRGGGQAKPLPLQPTMPEGPGHASVQLLWPDQGQPCVRVVKLAPAAAGRDGKLRLAVTQSGPTAKAITAAFGGELTPRPSQVLAPGKSDASDDQNRRLPGKPIALQFQPVGDGQFQADVAAVAPGLYELQLKLDPPGDVRFPVVVAAAGVKASATLMTYHNRCDYRRGEAVEVHVLLRAVEELPATQAELLLTDAHGRQQKIGQVEVSCPANSSRGFFVRLETSSLAPTWQRLELTAAGLIAFPLEFQLFPAERPTTFRLYSWDSASFSAPVLTGGKPTVNTLLNQRPTQLLHGPDLQRYTRQDVLPQDYEPILASDPLYPAPQRTQGYQPDTEADLASAMRLSMDYCPDYGWGLNNYEKTWNPKHTLPEDLLRMHRLCLLVAQRHRGFANLGGLYLNWFPALGGYWETNPPCDGTAGDRQALLQQELNQVHGKVESSINAQELGKLDAADARYRSEEAKAVRQAVVRVSRYRAATLTRAYDAWTSGVRKLAANDGLAEPMFASFLPVGWFRQVPNYPPLYFARLPLAGVHAYTDFGYAPLQPLWAADYFAAGVGDKPIWVTSMSDGRDSLLRQALLCAGRGVDGIDLNGRDPQASLALMDFFTRYGSYFQSLTPVSDVAILASFTQQVCEGDLVGQSSGYTGGAYYELYKNLWYARRPPTMLLEEELLQGRLERFQAIFLVHQRVPLSPPAMAKLEQFVQSGGKIFKDKQTADYYPGTVFELTPDPQASSWQPGRYNPNRDSIFVGTLAGYESVAKSLQKVLAQLGEPAIGSPDANLPVNALAGKQTAMFFAANHLPPPPGIEHPWNFWSATTMARRAEVSFAKPWVLYDLLDAGKELRPSQQGERFVLPVTFDRAAGKAFLATPAPIAAVRLAAPESSAGPIAIAASVLTEDGQEIADPMPFEIRVLDEQDREIQVIFRPLGPGLSVELNLPASSEGPWSIVATELASGRTARAKVRQAVRLPQMQMAAVGAAFPGDLARFLEPTRSAAYPLQTPPPAEPGDPFVSVTLAQQKQDPVAQPFVVLLDRDQAARLGPLAEKLAAGLNAADRKARVLVADPLDVVELPLRWQPTACDRAHFADARELKSILYASGLQTIYSKREKSINEPDYRDPRSGFGELGPRYRIFAQVLLLGSEEDNRFLADLHQAVGQRLAPSYPGPGSALVQVVFSAFTANHDVLSIQANDQAGLEAGVASVLAALGKREQGTGKTGPASGDQGKPQASSLKPVASSSLKPQASSVSTPLPNFWRERFGVGVYPMSFTADGSLLVGAGTQAANYFLLGPDNTVKSKWVGKYGLTPSGRGGFFWLSDWWGTPGYVDKILCAGAEVQPQWLMTAPQHSTHFQFWDFPGHRRMVDPASDDLFLAGHHQMARISPQGKVLWHYEDLDHCHDPYAFRFARDLMLHDVSRDGRFLLAAAFSAVPYSHFLSRLDSPELLLLDARTGKVLWNKPGVLIHHSACRFAQDKIIVADAVPGKERLALLDLEGKELWSMPCPQGASSAALSPEGSHLVFSPMAVRGRLFEVLTPPDAVLSVRLSDGAVRPLALPGTLNTWTMAQATGQVLVSTHEGTLACYQPDGKLLWQQSFDGTPAFLPAPDGKSICVGTNLGRLLRLDPQGKTLSELDLMQYQMVEDMSAYIRDYTRAPSGIPAHNLEPLPPPPLDQRSGQRVRFSANLLAGQKALADLDKAPLTAAASFSVNVQAGKTYVLSLRQKAAQTPAAASVLALTAGAYKSELPVSRNWEERLAAFRPEKSGPLTISLTCPPELTGGVAIEQLALWQLTLPSNNVLDQKRPGKVPDMSIEATDMDADLGLAPVEMPDVKLILPNDEDLAARARGAPPFRPAVDLALPFDGNVGPQKSSWLGTALAGKSTHATLTLTWKKPIFLSATAIFEEPQSAKGFTDTFALFAHDAVNNRWVKLGHRIGNRNPFNLFTFEPVRADMIQYLWISSADGHARLVEWEGYSPEEDLGP